MHPALLDRAFDRPACRVHRDREVVQVAAESMRWGIPSVPCIKSAWVAILLATHQARENARGPAQILFPEGLSKGGERDDERGRCIAAGELHLLRIAPWR